MTPTTRPTRYKKSQPGDMYICSRVTKKHYKEYHRASGMSRAQPSSPKGQLQMRRCR